jgi:hypothetical protein
MMREEGAAGPEFLQTSAVLRDFSVPPAQKNTSRSGAGIERLEIPGGHRLLPQFNIQSAFVWLHFPTFGLTLSRHLD